LDLQTGSGDASGHMLRALHKALIRPTSGKLRYFVTFCGSPADSA
jgi:hypothetical protein